jgi:hypothetical protein
MHVLLGLLLASVAVAAVVAGTGRRGLAGWILIGFGACFLIHAGITLAVAHANNGLIDSGDFYLLFATIPAGLLLCLAGATFFCARACAARLCKRSERA